MANPTWRITFPIEKAEQREDGYYLTGLASGPEIDATDERMSQDLVYRYADQINSSGGLALESRLPYRDAHAPDGVMRDLGWLTDASINKDQRLSVEVKLDEENPASMYLFRQVKNRNKKYGMSVAGKVLDYVDEWVTEVGKTIRTYKDVILTEISNTTRPAWTPSFGSVLAKAISDADSGIASGLDTPVEADVTPQGELMPKEEIQDAQKSEETIVVEAPDMATEAAEITTEETTVESAGDTTEKDMWDAASMSWTLGDIVSLLGYTDSANVADLRSAAQSLLAFISSEVGTAAKAKMDAASEEASKSGTEEVVVPEATAEVTAAEEQPEVDKSEEAQSDTGEQLLQAFTKAFSDALTQAGLLKKASPEAAAEADSQDTETPVEPVVETPSEETTQKTAAETEELEKSLAEQTAKVAALEAENEALKGSAPTILPPMVERQEADPDQFRKAVADLPRERRLAAAFAALTKGQ